MSARKLAKDLKNGYFDVSAAAEHHEKALNDEPKRDSEGIAQVNTEASGVLARENARRAAGSFEGGGPWPEDLIKDKFFTPLR